MMFLRLSWNAIFRRAAFGFAGTLCLTLIGSPWLTEAVDPAGPQAGANLIRAAFSKALFAEVNEYDAKAAVKVYTQIIAVENEVVTGAGSLVLDGTNALGNALRQGQVDVFSVTAEEFFTLENDGLVGPLLLASTKQKFTEELVLLVRKDSAIQTTRELKGHSMIVFSDIRASLARAWLEVLLLQNGLGLPDKALDRLTFSPKAIQVVLPVFFGKADACIITRNGWEVMSELNPQVRTQLRELAASPPLVPTMTCFRRGFSEDHKDRIVATAVNSQTKPAFQQLMALFKTDSLVQQPVAELAGTRELIATHRRLIAEGRSTTVTAWTLEGLPRTSDGTR